jgi:hypothetical protein
MPAEVFIGVGGTVVWEGHPSPTQKEAEILEAKIKPEMEK